MALSRHVLTTDRWHPAKTGRQGYSLLECRDINIFRQVLSNNTFVNLLWVDLALYSETTIKELPMYKVKSESAKKKGLPEATPLD
jgi:hypothetical protein